MLKRKSGKQVLAESEQKKPEKIKKIRVYKANGQKPVVIVLWVVFALGFTFAVYKNFTAIDTHTVHEKEVIEYRIMDTNGIERFVNNFAHTYYAWQNTAESIDARKAKLANYMTEDLQHLNNETLRKDIPVSSAVNSVDIWSVSQAATSEYDVVYTVSQQISGNGKNENVVSVYETTVHIDSNGNMVIVKNPTISNKPATSDYVPKAAEPMGAVSAVENKEVTEFLTTFFTLYPAATQSELSYYVSNNALPVVGKEYVFSKLVNPIYQKTDETIKAILGVEYLDMRTNMMQISQFEVTLSKADGNWKIVG